MSDLDRLRAEVKKRRAQVTKKIGRIRREYGANVGGTNFDPRRDPKTVAKYNRNQLNAYLNKLNEFQARGTAFVAGSGGIPIQKSKWLNYKRLENQYNQLGDIHQNKVADIFIPTAGMTIKQRQAMIHPTAVGEVVNAPYSKISRSPFNITSAESLDALTADISKKLTKEYLPSKIKEAREQLSEMLDVIGAPDLEEKANSLTDEQFDMLWNYTNFATAISMRYSIEKMRATNGKERWHDSVIEDTTDELGELFEWAGQITPGEETTTKSNKKNTQRKRR